MKRLIQYLNGLFCVTSLQFTPVLSRQPPVLGRQFPVDCPRFVGPQHAIRNPRPQIISPCKTIKKSFILIQQNKYRKPWTTNYSF